MLAMSRFKLTCRFVFGVVALVVLMSAHTAAQNAGVVLNGGVSATVTLSVPRIQPLNTIKTDVVSTGNNRVDITFSSADKNGVIRLPLLVRSNCGFKLTAVLNSNAAVVTQVAIPSVQPTGPLVSRQAVRDVKIARQFDARGPEDPGPVALELSQSLLLLSGPRVSLGGTLDSPGNALEIVLLIHLKSESGPATSQLTLLATPEL